MKRNSAIIFLGGMLSWISLYIYVPVLSTYSASLGASPEMIGLIGGVYGLLPIILCTALAFIAGSMTKDKLFLILGFVIILASSLIFLFFKSVTGVLIGRAIAAAGSGWWVIIAAVYAKYQPEDQEVKGQGVLNFGSNLGKIIGCALCMALAASLGTRILFIIAAAAAIVGIIITLGLKKVKTRQPAEPASLKEQMSLFKNADVWKFSVLALLTQMISFGGPVTFTPMAAHKLGADTTMLGLIQLIYVSAVAAGCLVVGTKLYKKFGGVQMMALSFALCAVSCVPAFYNDIVSICIMQILSGLAYGLTLAALTGFVVLAVPNADRTGALGVFESIYSVGIFLGPTIAGNVVQKLSYAGAYWVFFALSSLAAVLSLIIIPKKFSRAG